MCLRYVFGDSTDNLRYIWRQGDWFVEEVFAKWPDIFHRVLAAESCWTPALRAHCSHPLVLHSQEILQFNSRATGYHWLILSPFLFFFQLTRSNIDRSWRPTSHVARGQPTNDRWGCFRVDLARLFRKDLVDRRYEPFKDFQSQVFYFQFLEVKCE